MRSLHESVKTGESTRYRTTVTIVLGGKHGKCQCDSQRELTARNSMGLGDFPSESLGLSLPSRWSQLGEINSERGKYHWKSHD